MGALFWSQNCLHANHYSPDQDQDSETVETEQKQRTSNNGGDCNRRISTTRLSLSLPFLKKQQMNSTTVHPSTNGKSSRFGSWRRTRTTYNIKRNKWDVAMWEEQLIEQGHSLTFTHTHTFNSCTEFDIFHCCKVGVRWLLVTLMVGAGAGAGAGPLKLLALSSINPPQTLYFLKRLAHVFLVGFVQPNNPFLFNLFMNITHMSVIRSCVQTSLRVAILYFFYKR